MILVKENLFQGYFFFIILLDMLFNNVLNIFAKRLTQVLGQQLEISAKVGFLLFV